MTEVRSSRCPTGESTTRRYVWDGYNIAAELVIDETVEITNVTYYTWGLDVSGTVQVHRRCRRTSGRNENDRINH